jgi:hypothetical protein
MADGFSRPIFKYSHQAGAVASTQIKTGPGVLRAITVGTTGATPGTITLADNTVPNTTNPITIVVPAASSNAVTYEYDIGFNSGLVYTNVGGTTADVTVCYL